MQSRRARVARGWIAGSFATAVAAVSHGLADGAAPSALAILTALVFAGVLGTFAIGRRPSLPRTIIVVAGSQLAFHLVFSWLTPGTATAAGHHEVATILAPAVAHHGVDPLMWAAHGVALAATVLFLSRAERALWHLLRDALAALGAPRLPALAARPPLPRPARTAEPRHPLLVVLRAALVRRGPPLLARV